MSFISETEKLWLYIRFFILSLLIGGGIPAQGVAYPFATYVLDANTGKTLYSLNADKKLHPASLTKMMTLYLTFNEVESKKLALDQKVVISKNAAREPPSKFGYRAGQKVSIRYLIRAAAIRSANDAATALGEAISGSEKNFGLYMTRAAKAMGMKNTTFKNANGLTRTGHISTARDMAILARRLIYDFPEYYHLFGRNSVISSGRKLYNTNRKFLASYSGADGIKTGFTSAAGYNLAASAGRDKKRVIGIVFGSGSVKLRTQRMTELLDIGFAKAVNSRGMVSLPSLILNSAEIKVASLNGSIFKASAPPRRPESFYISSDGGKLNLTIKALLDLAVEVENSDQMRPLVRPHVIADIGKVITSSNSEKTLKAKLLTILELDEDSKRKYSVLVGSYFTEYNAKKDLTRLTLADFDTLSSAKKVIEEGVIEKKLVFRVKFSELKKSDALKACKKLKARNELCDVSLDQN